MKHKLIIGVLCIFIVTAYCSCSFFEDRYAVECQFFERSPWEHEVKTQGWYRLRYLVRDGEVEELLIPAHVSSVTIYIPKGVPCIVAAYPFGVYTPVGGMIQPEKNSYRGSDSLIYLGLSSRFGPTADALLTYRNEFADIVSEIDLQDLGNSVYESTDGRPWAADWGSLYMELMFASREKPAVDTAENHPADLYFDHGGWWLCDKRGIDPVSIPYGGGLVSLQLPAGTYGFYNPEVRRYLQIVTIFEDGSFVRERHRVPAILR
jgi:hypothetical protein